MVACFTSCCQLSIQKDASLCDVSPLGCGTVFHVAERKADLEALVNIFNLHFISLCVSTIRFLDNNVAQAMENSLRPVSHTGNSLHSFPLLKLNKVNCVHVLCYCWHFVPLPWPWSFCFSLLCPVSPSSPPTLLLHSSSIFTSAL